MADDTYVKLKKTDAEAIRSSVQAKTGGTGTMTAPQVKAAIDGLVTVGDVDVVDSGSSTTVID